MINRKDFLKNCAVAACATGLCCVSKIEAQSSGDMNLACDPKELADAQNRSDAARLRFSKLIEVIEARLSEPERKKVLHVLGGKCADTFRASLIDRYKGDIRGFLEEGRRNWMAEATCDEASGSIRIVDKGPHCSCPMVKERGCPARPTE